MSLVGNRYIQANDPGAVGVGYQWLDTDTSLLYERNGSNTAWVQVYNTNQTNGGLLPQTGGSVTGAITGTTGWAPSDNPNFATAAKIAGQNIATVNYVNQQVSSFNDVLSAKISQAIAATTSSINTNANIAKSGQGAKLNGYFSPKQNYPQTSTTGDAAVTALDAIPLPYYPDSGGQAQESDCIWIGTMALSASDRNQFGSRVVDNSVSGKSWISIFYQTATNRVYKSYLYQGSDSSFGTNFTFTSMGMNWLIFAVNSSQ
jgi:hypothetical protein